MYYGAGAEQRARLPLARLGPFRWMRLDGSFADLGPVCAEGGAVALDEALHHCALGVWVGLGIELFEEGVDGAGRGLLLVVVLKVGSGDDSGIVRFFLVIGLFFGGQN